MRLYLYRRNETGNWTIRGTDFAGRKIFESTRTADKGTAEALRVKLEHELLSEAVHGKKAIVTFGEAALSYLEAGGERRFLGVAQDDQLTGLIGKLETVPLKNITQSMIDRLAVELHPNLLPESRNRIFYTPFIAVWHHAVRNEWADLKSLDTTTKTQRNKGRPSETEEARQLPDDL